MLQSGDTITVTGDGLRPVTSGLSPRRPARRCRSAAARWCARIKGPKNDWRLTQLPEVEGAFVALDPRSGAIRALVGGFDFGKSKFNHVLQAWRQPGSSFKPFIYSAALEKGFTPATVVNDAPLFFDADETGSQPWEPKNYDGKFDGPMPLMTAWRSRRTWSRSASCRPSGRPTRRNGSSASASSRQAPGLPDDGAGRRVR
jgi:penicillin-binding protein 1A